MNILWWPICEIMPIKYNHLKCSGTRILKTVIFYIASALSSQPIIKWSLVWQHRHDVLMNIYTFFLLFVHILNTQFYSIYLKQKKSISEFFFHILIQFCFGCIMDIQKKFKKNRKPASLKADKQLNAFLLFF